MNDLSGDRSGEITQEEQDGIGHGVGVGYVPSEGCSTVPCVDELIEPADTLCSDRAEWTRRHAVDPNGMTADIASKVPSDRLQSRLGHAHPVVGRPGHRGVEVETDHAPTAVTKQWE